MNKLLLITLLTVGAGQALAAGYNGPAQPGVPGGPEYLTPGKNNSCPAGYQLAQRFKHCTNLMYGTCWQGTGAYYICMNEGYNQ